MINLKNIFRSELFGSATEWQSFQSKRRQAYLQLLMEKLFIIMEGDNYFLRIENDAPPISLYLREKRGEPDLGNEEGNVQDSPLASQGEHSPIPGTPSSSRSDRSIGVASGGGRAEREEAKFRAFITKELQFSHDLLREAEKISKYQVISGKMFKVTAYFIEEKIVTEMRKNMVTEQKKKNSRGVTSKNSPAPALGSYNKKGLKVVVYLQAYSKSLDFTSAREGLSGKPWNANSLVQMLFKFEDLKKISEFSQEMMTLEYKDEIFSTIVNALVLDSSSGSLVILEDKAAEEAKRKGRDDRYVRELVNGGSFLTREMKERRTMDLHGVEERLVTNQDFASSEHTYDIKIFEVTTKESRSFRFEIFAVNDPELVYSCSVQAAIEGRHGRNKVLMEVFNLFKSPFDESSFSSTEQHNAQDSIEGSPAPRAPYSPPREVRQIIEK